MTAAMPGQAALCDAGTLWFLPCSDRSTVAALQGRRTRFDQLRHVLVCGRHAELIKTWPLWVIRPLAGAR